MTNIQLIPEEEMSENIHETEEDIKKRYRFVISYFQKHNPEPKTELNYKNGYELLVAVILSAQTADRRVNVITPALFEKYPTPEGLARANPDEVYRYINSVNYANNKSDYLVRMANILVNKYEGKIPENIDDLQTLPGVGRKTAHVIAATLFNKPVIAVDTHVMRVSERIGLTTNAEKPLGVEEQLARYTPKEVMSKMSHWLILHGRYTCTAKTLRCSNCGLRKICRYYNTSLK